MSELWRFLRENEGLLLLLVFWIVSMLGGLMTRAARKAAERQRQEQRKELRDARQEQRQPEPAARERETTARTGDQRRMDPEDIARQIRRAMGLETEEQPPPAPAERPRPKPRAAEPPPPPVVVVKQRPRGLAEELRERDQRDRLARKRQPTLGAGVSARTLQRFEPHILTAKRRRSHRAVTRAVDLRRPAAAIVALEVLGPPVALRDREAHPFRAR